MPHELQKCNIPELTTTDMCDEDRAGAIWQVTYDYVGKNVFYLTDEEKDFFLITLTKGANFVDIKGYILSGKFLTIRLCEDKYRRYSNPVLSEGEFYAPDGSVITREGGVKDDTING